MQNPDLTVSHVREKAKTLKSIIEGALKTFREETGHIPTVEVETKTQKTNTKDFTSQIVNVTVQM